MSTEFVLLNEYNMYKTNRDMLNAWSNLIHDKLYEMFNTIMENYQLDYPDGEIELNINNNNLKVTLYNKPDFDCGMSVNNCIIHDIEELFGVKNTSEYNSKNKRILVFKILGEEIIEDSYDECVKEIKKVFKEL
jgi:hypothetical protein